MAPTTRSRAEESKLKNRLRSKSKVLVSRPSNRSPPATRANIAKALRATTRVSKGTVSVKSLTKTKPSSKTSVKKKPGRCLIDKLPKDILIKILNLVAGNNKCSHPTTFHAFTRSSPHIWAVYKSQDSHYDRLALSQEPYNHHVRPKKPHSCYRYIGNCHRTLQAIDIIERHKAGEKFRRMSKGVVIHRDLDQVPVDTVIRLCRTFRKQIAPLEEIGRQNPMLGLLLGFGVGSLGGRNGFLNNGKWNSDDLWGCFRHYLFRGCHGDKDHRFVTYVTGVLDEVDSISEKPEWIG